MKFISSGEDLTHSIYAIKLNTYFFFKTGIKEIYLCMKHQEDYDNA